MSYYLHHPESDCIWIETSYEKVQETLKLNPDINELDEEDYLKFKAEYRKERNNEN